MKFRKRQPTAAAASPDDDDQLPIPGYSQLKGKEISDQLSQLSQVELATVETYERAHGNRSAVLEKLRYMRGTEPLPGYDELTPEQIAERSPAPTRKRSEPYATTSASSSAAGRSSMKPHACCRHRGRAPTRRGP